MKSFTTDDSGASMLLEYIFTIIISSLLFTMLLLNLGSIIGNSDRIIMSEEVDIAASVVANQLADYSNELYLNDITMRTSDYSALYSMAATQDDSFKLFNLPKPYSGRQYIVEVKDSNEGLQRGIVKVTYASDPGVYSIANFNMPVPVEYKKITCNSYNMKISYDPSVGKVILEEV